MTPNNDYHSAPPFVEFDAEKNYRHHRLSQLAMIAGLIWLMITFVSGGKLILDLLLQDGKVDGLMEKMLLLVLAFASGWLTCLVSIRTLENLLLPYLLRGFSWLVVTCILLFYAWIAFQLFNNADISFKYLLLCASLLTVGFIILVALGLLLEQYDMRPLSYPLLAGAAFHLFIVIIYYFFMVGSKPENIRGHLFFFVFILVIALLMLLHLGILNPARQFIDILFARDKKSLHLD